MNGKNTMPTPDDERFFDDHLSALPDPPDLSSTYESDLLSRVRARHKAGRRKLLRYALPLAAVAALLLFKFGPWTLTGGTADSNSQAAVTDMFLVLKTQPKESAAYIKETKDFQVKQLRAGDPWDGNRLDAVTADSLAWKDAAGRVSETSVADINRDTESSLKKECAGLQALYKSGSFTPAHFARLSLLAAESLEEAQGLMKTIAAGNSDLAEQAGEQLQLNSQLKQHNRLKTWVLTGSEESQLRALKALGDETGSPLALATLTDLACTLPEGEAAQQCISFVSQYPAMQAEPALRRIAGENRDEQVRQAALRGLNQIREKNSHAK